MPFPRLKYHHQPVRSFFAAVADFRTPAWDGLETVVVRWFEVLRD
jgi:hypothetical protein